MDRRASLYDNRSMRRPDLLRAEQAGTPEARESREDLRCVGAQEVLLTEAGTKAVKAHSVKALAELRAVHSSVLLGMIHWPLLDKPVTLHALWLVQQPFRIDGDHAYGLGIADDKHGIVFILHALTILNALGVDGYGVITVVMSAD